jgi:undecaprenyl diphosphate synthase
LQPPSESRTGWPVHVAIIMDGNGRWAKLRHLPRLEGHRQGAKAVRRAVEFARSNGIRFLTLYAFSTENWRRPSSEVSGLMKLLSQFLDSELEELHRHDIRFHTIGDPTRLPEALRRKIDAGIERTRNNSSLLVSVALSYGGREEIVSAARTIAAAAKSGTLDEQDLDQSVFEQFLFTHGLPDPDLLIRTGGEMRVSNFLLWQCAYAELYFMPILWPDFGDAAFLEAVQAYGQRQRRFGMISEQVPAGEGGV